MNKENHESLAKAKNLTSSWRISILVLFAVYSIIGMAFRGDNTSSGSRPIKHQVTGLFHPDREKDLRDVFAKLPKFKLIGIDYENAEVTVEYNPAKVWPGEKPERYTELFSNEIGNVSRNTFRAKPLRSKPLDKFKRVQIPVEGLDCLGCCYGAYRIIFELPGVETATADFKKRLVTALIDPDLTTREKLVEALKKAGVEIESTGK